MAGRVFAAVGVVALFLQRQTRDSASRMSLDGKTVRKYAGRAEATDMVPGGPPLSQAEWVRRHHLGVPEPADDRRSGLGE